MSDAPRSLEPLPAPAPLTPADCDLQDFAFMPLHVARLRDSDMASEADPEACWYAVLLWAASWHQVPAASLPDNAAILTRLCGLGRDVATFTRLRDDVLRGFVKCDDGRLYHPVVAEQALESWVKKQSYQARKAERTEIAKRAADARWARDGSPKDDAGIAGAVPDASTDDASCMHHASETDASSKPDAMPKGTGTGTGTKERKADASLSSRRAAATEGGAGEADEVGWDEVRDLYGSAVIRGRGSPMLARSAWLRLDEPDRRALPAAIRAYAEAKPWGSNGPPGLQRFLAEEVWREFASTASVTSIVWRGPEDLRAAVAAEKGDGFARSFLDPAEWRAATDSGPASILPLNPTAAARLRTCRSLAAVAIQDPILPRRRA